MAEEASISAKLPLRTATLLRRKPSRVATLPARGSASLPEKAQVVLHLWVIAALLTLLFKAAMS